MKSEVHEQVLQRISTHGQPGGDVLKEQACSNRLCCTCSHTHEGERLRFSRVDLCVEVQRKLILDQLSKRDLW